MKLYMDESGNGNPDQPLVVGAVEPDGDLEDVEQRIGELYRELCARKSMAGLPSFENFRKHGFHASTDPTEVSVPFLELMREINFKAYILVTDRSSVQGTELQQLEFMYENLLGDLLLRHRKHKELVCSIEQNDSLKKCIANLPVNAARRAHEKLGRKINLPRLSVAMVPKTEALSMAVIDYVMSAVSKWLRGGKTTDPQARSYRAFREVEPFISVLYSFETGVISSRKTALH